MHKPLTYREMWAIFIRQSRLALNYLQQQVKHTRWETRHSQVESFCIEYIVAAISESGNIWDTVFFLVFWRLKNTAQDIHFVF